MFRTHANSIVAIFCIALCQFCFTGPTNADFLYVVHGGATIGAPFGGEIGYLNLDTLEYSSLGTPVPGAGLTGIAYTSNQLYASTSNHSLAILNLKGGLISETPFFGADFDVAAGDRVTDLAATRSGDLYASVGLIGGNNRLFSVEPSTGELVLIGPLPANVAPFMSLAFVDARLFGHSANSATVFYEIDIATGAATNTISGGVSTGALGLGFNPNNQLLYASTSTAFGSPNDQIYSLDPVSGVAVQLVDFDDDRRIHDLEFVPQPRFNEGDMYIVHGGANVGAPFGGDLGIVDTDTGVYISLGTPVPGAGLTGLAYSGTRLFASTSNHTLAVMDISGGLLSETPFVGAGFNAAAGDRVTDLASTSVGQIYAAARIGGVDTLCLVFSDIAELFPIGPLPTDNGSFHALAFAGDFASDTLYNHQAVFPGVFNEIDINTGASLNAIPGGVPGGTIALGYNRVDRRLYGSEFELATQYSEQIYSVDRSTGAAVKIFDFNDGRRIHDIEFIPAQMYVVHGGANAGAPFGGELGIIDVYTRGYRTLGTPVAGAGLTGLANIRPAELFAASTSNHTLALIDYRGVLLAENQFYGAGFDPVGALDRVTDLAANRAGELFAAVRLSSVQTLCSVAGDGELVPMGPLPEDGGGFHALAFVGGSLFSHQTSVPGPVFNDIDVNTGASINLISGGVPGGALGMGYSRGFGLLFASECCNGSDGALGERIFAVVPNSGGFGLFYDYDDGRRIQDLEFIDNRIVKLLLSESVTPTRGVYVAGGIGELAFSDNADYQMRRNIADIQARTEFVVKGISPTPVPSSLEVALEGSVFARSTVVQSIDLYDYNTGAWEAIGASTASRFVDSTVYFEAQGDVSRFVQPVTGYMEARIRFQSSNPRQQFASNTDLFNWMIGL